MKRKTEASPLVFTDLVQELTEADHINRKIVEKAITTATTLNEFTANWESLQCVLCDGGVITGSVDKNNFDECEGREQRYMCRLVLTWKGMQALRLQFWVRPNPTLYKDINSSPVRAYHTKVSVGKVEGFVPFKYYDTIMYLIRKMLPPDTKLMLYVRQRDSRELLDNGADPRQVPLSKVFQKAGWKFERYFDDRVSKDPLRRHRLVLST